MTRRRRGAPRRSVAPDEVIIGWTDAFTLAPGNALRAASCLVCANAAGAAPVRVFAVFQFRIPADRCGVFPAASWLVHTGHPLISDDALASLALGRHHLCLEETS